MSDQPIDLIPALLREVRADLAEIKATIATMATKGDMLALRRDLHAMRAGLVSDIRSEFNLLHSRLDALEQTR